MSLDRYRLRAQLGAGLDGVAYRAVPEDGETEVEVWDLSCPTYPWPVGTPCSPAPHGGAARAPRGHSRA